MVDKNVNKRAKPVNMAESSVFVDIEDIFLAIDENILVEDEEFLNDVDSCIIDDSENTNLSRQICWQSYKTSGGLKRHTYTNCLEKMSKDDCLQSNLLSEFMYIPNLEQVKQIFEWFKSTIQEFMLEEMVKNSFHHFII